RSRLPEERSYACRSREIGCPLRFAPSDANPAGGGLRTVADAHVYPAVQTEEVGRVDIGEPRVTPVDTLGPHDRDVDRVSHDRVVDLPTDGVPLAFWSTVRLVEEPVDLRVVQVHVVAVGRRQICLAGRDRVPEPNGGREVRTPTG